LQFEERLDEKTAALIHLHGAQSCVTHGAQALIHLRVNMEHNAASPVKWWRRSGTGRGGQRPQRAELLLLLLPARLIL